MKKETTNERKNKKKDNRNETTNNNKKENKKRKISNLAAGLVLLFSLFILFVCLAINDYFASNDLYQIYGNDLHGVIKNNFEEISRRYSIYAMDDYLQDFNMDILENTNFKYGVIHSDNFKDLDIADLSNYEVQNFDEEFNPERVNIYSCYRDADTYISYDLAPFGYASLVNNNNLYEEISVPITQFIYNYNNNQLYAAAENYLFPLTDASNMIIKPSENAEVLEITEENLPANAQLTDTPKENSTEYPAIEEKVNQTEDITPRAQDVLNDNNSAEAIEDMGSEDSIASAKTETVFSYDEDGRVTLQDGQHTYVINSDEDGYQLETDGTATQIPYSDFQEEVLVMSEQNYVWRAPYSFLYLPQLSCMIPLCDVTIADFHTIHSFGTVISSEASSKYFFEKNNMTITYSQPVERIGVSYYVISYVPQELDLTKEDLYTQTYRILNIAYKLRYLPYIIMIAAAILVIFFSLLLLIRFLRCITYFYRENMPLVMKLITLFVLLTGAEILFLAGGSYVGVFHVSRRLVLFLLLEKLCIAPFLIHYTLQLRKLQKESSYLASGDYTHSFSVEHMSHDFRKVGQNLNQMRDGMQTAINDRMKSEHFKTELITNVSHDIKTPLTSIVNYVDLLKKEEIESPHSAEYLDVLERQSNKLKKLLEDLIEAAKASTGNLKVEPEICDVSVLISQVTGEYEERLAEKTIELCTTTPEKPVYIQSDTRYLQRVFDNLMTNIYKYAMPGTRAYLNLETIENVACVTIKNVSQAPLNITSEELLERFVQGDASRNTEGHGLGLTISQSLMELMGGRLILEIDGDLFKVTLQWDVVEAPVSERETAG